MAQVVMVVHEEKGRYGASFPDFPGCTTVARDLDELYRKAAEVLTAESLEAVFGIEAAVTAEGEGLAITPRRALPMGPG